MWHPIAVSHPQPQAEQAAALHTIEEEPHSFPRAAGATSWTPLQLSPVEHVKYVPDQSSNSTPFDAELPAKIPEEYQGGRSGILHYALYSLAHLSRDDVSDLLQTIKYYADKDAKSQVPKVARAPIYDFCSNKTLRDIYDYHTSLLDDGNHGIAYGRFIVAAHTNWETQGLLIVDFDCQPNDRGTLGILRVDASMLGQHLTLLETSNRNWTDLKAAELGTRWPGPIPGYSGSRYKTLGYQFCERNWLKGDY